MVEAMIKALCGTALLVAIVVPNSGSYAHQLDEYLQATLVEIDPSAIRLQINLTPGVEVADEVLVVIDRNHDDHISDEEGAAYAELLKRDLVVRLDGRAIESSVTALNTPKPSDLRTGWGILQMEFTLAPLAVTAGEHELILENRHLSSLSDYLFNAARPRSDSIRIISQNRNDTQSECEIQFAYDPITEPSQSGLVASLAVFVCATAVAIMWFARSR